MSKTKEKLNLELVQVIPENLKFSLVPIENCFIDYNRSRWPDPKHIRKLLKKSSGSAYIRKLLKKSSGSAFSV